MKKLSILLVFFVSFVLATFAQDYYIATDSTGVSPIVQTISSETVQEPNYILDGVYIGLSIISYILFFLTISIAAFKIWDYNNRVKYYLTYRAQMEAPDKLKLSDFNKESIGFIVAIILYIVKTYIYDLWLGVYSF